MISVLVMVLCCIVLGTLPLKLTLLHVWLIINESLYLRHRCGKTKLWAWEEVMYRAVGGAVDAVLDRGFDITVVFGIMLESARVLVSGFGLMK